MSYKKEEKKKFTGSMLASFVYDDKGVCVFVTFRSGADSLPPILCGILIFVNLDVNLSLNVNLVDGVTVVLFGVFSTTSFPSAVNK